MKTLAQDTSLLKHSPQPIVLESACAGCAEFLPSDRTPSVGICLFHAVRVLAQDKVCSQYYQEENDQSVNESASSDDEF